MKNEVVPRRQFLKGTCGFTLALPFLPSLLPRSAQSATFVAPKRFFSMQSGHGGVSYANMYPLVTPLSRTVEIVAGHEVRAGLMQASPVGAKAVVSPVLSADSGVLTSRLLSKMNVLRGLDVPCYIGHNSALSLGNYARNNHIETKEEFVPTVDQVLAWSPSFYPNLDGVVTRSMIIGRHGSWAGGGMSWNFSNASMRSGPITEVAGPGTLQKAFDQLFGTAKPKPAPRKPIVDRVVENYRSLVQGNARLSADDRRRVEAHLSMLAELQRKLSVVAAASCSEATAPLASVDAGGGSAAEDVAYFRAANDLTAVAFACGATRVMTYNVIPCSFFDWTGSWHQEVAHQHLLPERQTVLASGNQRTFEGVLLDLAKKLDALEDAAGTSVLDNSLLTWTHESGAYTHDSDSVPVVTFGSAGGYLKTGQFIDYRKRAPKWGLNAPWANPQDPERLAGVPHPRFLATVLQALGSPVQEWQSPAYKGYGQPYGVTRPIGGAGGSGDEPWQYRDKYNTLAPTLNDPLPHLV